MSRRPHVPNALTRGPFTLAEAARAGLSERQLRGPTWRRLAPGLYCWAGWSADTTAILRAIQGRLPARSAFSGRTAGWLHGLKLDPCSPIEVTIDDPLASSKLTGITVRRRRLGANEVAAIGGVVTTTALRTVVDLGRDLPVVDGVAALDMALHERLLEPRELHDYVSRHPKLFRVSRLRRALALADPAAESPMETELRVLLVLAGLPRPESQVRLYDDEGRFVGRPDLYYPARRLAIEYDGAVHRDSLVQDNQRQNLLLGAGYRLLRFTAADLRGSPQIVISQVRTALAA